MASPSFSAVPRLRLGTRGSALALAQSGQVADALRALGADVELVIIRTAGDDRPPDAVWGEGAFVGALETALLDGRIDVAVHSAKDVPTLEDGRLSIAAFPAREDPRDAIVGRQSGLTLDTLPVGARVGTDSPRRSTFLRAVRPDLRIHPLHGNVDTRLRRLDAGETDALVLAVAGLTRLGRASRIDAALPPDVLPPAPGQGALALQCRAGDAATFKFLARLDHAETRIAVEAERAFLGATGGGCRAPIGALGTVVEGELQLLAGTAGREPVLTQVGAEDDSAEPTIAWGEAFGPGADRVEIASRLAADLTARLADAAVPNAVREDATAGPGPTIRSHFRRRVLVTRPAAQAGSLVPALARRGFEPAVIPTIAIEPVEPGGPLDAALLGWDGSGWIAVTSANGATAVLDAAERLGVQVSAASWAAVGDATRVALEARGIPVAFVPSVADGERLAEELPLVPGTAVLLPRADLADDRLVALLQARGAKVNGVVAYRTIQGPTASRERLRAYFAESSLAAIVFTSGSTVVGLETLLAAGHRATAHDTIACCIGERTATVAREHGFRRVLVSQVASPEAIADLLAAEQLLAELPEPTPVAEVAR